jgi:hypothetical protein
MKIYVFMVEGQPRIRTDWRQAQGALEDHLRDQRDVSDVHWADEGDERWRATVYLYGCSHSDISANPEDDPYQGMNFETTDQLIWEFDIGGVTEMPVPQDGLIEGMGALLELRITTETGVESVTRAVPKPEWEGPHWMRGHALWRFASETALNLGIRWSQGGSK